MMMMMMIAPAVTCSHVSKNNDNMHVNNYSYDLLETSSSPAPCVIEQIEFL